MLKIRLNGVVQGVGFRPFIYRLARQLALKGWILNSSSGVEIAAQGTATALESFLARIPRELPPGARIQEMQVREEPDEYFRDFSIRSSRDSEGSTLVSPDLAICADCTRELFNHPDHRYRYPFINCTNCGPRYTIIENLPYDRPRTSMQFFPLCDFCGSEYLDPLNRRFHAQPVACADCGPQLALLDNNLNPVAGEPIAKTAALLKAGKIVAIKGIGGFHLACDPLQPEVVVKLRQLKNRPHKPFAVMCRPELAGELVRMTQEHIRTLSSPQAPILILPKQDIFPLAEEVAPGNPNLGIFFPYAPHHLLLMAEDIPWLIMTSGNLNNEPVAAEEHELQGLCDYFLSHNRPILNRCDDSVLLPTATGDIFLRRSRGYVPSPLPLPFGIRPTLGCGAELKLTFALGKGEQVFISPYLGNDNNKRTYNFYLETLHNFQRWFRIQPELMACDLQPDFFTTGLAEESGLPLVRVQHHFAHIASVMAEHRLNEPVLGVAYDGTGYGTDGAIWGGEILKVEYTGYQRLFHLQYLPLPGGDAAIRRPIRIAYAYALALGLDTALFSELTDMERVVIAKQVETGFNVFRTSSMGRLFDAVATMLGLFPEISFEAQSALALEFLCHDLPILDQPPYPCEIRDNDILIAPILSGLMEDIKRAKKKEQIAARFHRTIMDFTLQALQRARKTTGLTKVVLAGGVMQNKIIFTGLVRSLTENGFQVYTPGWLSPNDEAISLGQLVIANAMQRGR